MKAFRIGCGFSGVPSRSSVVMSAQLIVLIGVRHVRTARPLTMAVQEPHWPRPQPNFGPFSCKSSLRTYNSGVVGSTSTVWDCPLTFNVKTLMWCSPSESAKSRIIRRLTPDGGRTEKGTEKGVLRAWTIASGRLESQPQRELHDPLPGGAERLAEARVRRQDIGCRVDAVQRVVDGDDVVGVQ